MKKINTDDFNLLKSEITKAEKCANNYSGYTDCKVTAYSVHFDRPLDFDPDAIFANVICEICRNYEKRCDFDVTLTIPMFDRRRTTAKIKL